MWKSTQTFVADTRKQILTKSQNVWHPVRVTEKQRQQQQQQRDQPEVRPGNETGYRQMVGGNLHVVVFFCKWTLVQSTPCAGSTPP